MLDPAELESETQALLAERKRLRGVERISNEALGDEYRSVHDWTERLDEAYDTYPLDVTEHGKKLRLIVRRNVRANWEYMERIQKALLSRGTEGVAVLEALFLGDDPRLRYRLARLASMTFPDTAEPALLELAELPREMVSRYAYGDGHRDYINKLVVRIRGYRARGPRAMEPELGGFSGAGLAPALRPDPRTPIDFQEDFRERLAIALILGGKRFEDACLDAWAWIAEEKGLEPAVAEEAELATFDFEIRERIRVAVFTGFQQDNIIEAVHRIQFIDQSGDLVPDIVIGTVLFHTILMSSESWTGGTAWSVRERIGPLPPTFTAMDYINTARGQ